MTRITKQYKNFNQSLSSDLDKKGFHRMEHFNVIGNRLRPFGTVDVSTIAGDATELTKYFKFVLGTRGATTENIWALAQGDTTGYYGISYWDRTNFRWYTFQSFNASGATASFLLFYNSKIYGLWKGTHMWEMQTDGTFNGTYKAISYTNYADHIIHTKDGLAYIPTDNILSSFDGTDLTTVLTLPTNFIITTICEYGDYINIAGYDSKTKKATMYQWDRDSSLATLTSKYELGTKTPHHIATLGGTCFIVSMLNNPDNSRISEPSYLTIDYLENGKIKELDRFLFTTLNIGGKFLDEKKLYFNASIKPQTETDEHWVVFELNENGILRGAVNMGVNDSAGTVVNPSGLYKSGDGFWIGGGADGAWNTDNDYNTSSFFETTNLKSDKLTEDVDLIGAVIKFESLPNAGVVTVKTKADNESTWTTLGTFNTDEALEGVMTGNVSGITTCKQRRFRAESTGNAVIKAFQVDLETVKNKLYS